MAALAASPPRFSPGPAAGAGGVRTAFARSMGGGAAGASGAVGGVGFFGASGAFPAVTAVPAKATRARTTTLSMTLLRRALAVERPAQRRQRVHEDEALVGLLAQERVHAR